MYKKFGGMKALAIGIALISDLVVGSFTFSSIPALADKSSQPITVKDTSSPKFKGFAVSQTGHA